MGKVYFDYAASAPIDTRVIEAMVPYFKEKFGNPGSVHSFGRDTQAALDLSRQTIAGLCGVDFNSVIFASSATEANNLIIQGVIKQIANSKWQMSKNNSPFAINHKPVSPHIITSVIEHESVLEPCRDLEKRGLAEVSYLPVNRQGFVEAQAISRELRRETVLVSIMAVNNVTGAIQPLLEISKIIKEFKKQKLSLPYQSQYTPQELMYPIFHSDAAQAIHSLKNIALPSLGVEAITVSSHKIYGPKGGGALVADFSLPAAVAPLLMGGKQEFGLRASTPDIPNIVGFSQAFQLVRQELDQEATQTQELKALLLSGIKKLYPRAVVNSYEPCIAGVFNVSFPGFDLEELLYRFDQKGIAVAAGSACSAKALKPSHVLTAMGVEETLINSAIRFSFGKFTTREEIKYCLEQLSKILS